MWEVTIKGDGPLAKSVLAHLALVSYISIYKIHVSSPEGKSIASIIS